MSRTPWPLATRENPCVVCGSTHNCRNAPDGTGAVCWHNGNGGEVIQLEKPAKRTPKPDDYGIHQKPASPRKTFTSWAEAIAAYRKGPPAAAWTYRDADGVEVLVVARWNLPDGGKNIRPVGFVGTGWVKGDPEPPFPLYGLAEILAADPAETIFIVEGEKCADAARSIGMLATTSAHGAGSAARTEWGPLAGHPVVICPDNDLAGEKYAQDVIAILADLEVPNDK